MSNKLDDIKPLHKNNALGVIEKFFEREPGKTIGHTPEITHIVRGTRPNELMLE